MDFPAYVPAAVREYVTKLIEGDSWEPVGWQESLSHAERRLAEIDEKIQSCIRWGKDHYLPGLRIERAEAVAHRDSLKAEVDCLRRLVQDVRMREAYAILTREFTDDRQWRNFIYAAWAARVDFAKYRDRLKRAAELASEIAETAETLARLIRQFSANGINGPGEFYSVPELLRQTDNHEMEGRNLHMWRSMRRVVLGETPGIAPEEKARNTLRCALGVAPEVSELLETLANAARSFNPSVTGMIGAAVESRQRSLKSGYLRAFGKALTDHGIALTTPVMKAMATTATVVIDLPNVDVTYDDVRKALAKPGVERLENSS
jgi:hypothetical protein